MDKTLANDKYNITSSDVDIYDESGDDIYNFTYTYAKDSWSDVTDKGGKDAYTLKYTLVDTVYLSLEVP